MQIEQISLKIPKILLWNSSEPTFIRVYLYSFEHQHLIAQKTAQVMPVDNYLNLNMQFLIKNQKNEENRKNNQFQNQRKVIIVVQERDKYIGEVECDISQSKQKYYALEGGERIMQVEVVLEDKIKKNNQSKDLRQFQQKIEKNRRFMEGREKFMQNYIISQNSIKQQFQSKLALILKQPKNSHFLNIYAGEVKKSVNIQQFNQQGNQNFGQKQSQMIQKKVTQSLFVKQTKKRHKLMLDTLNIVPKQEGWSK